MSKIYTSPLPPTPIDASSVFTHLWGVTPGRPDCVGEYPGYLKAYVDAETGTTLTRAQVRDFALRVGWALKSCEEIGAKRGDVIMIFSPNSLSWPVALFGSVAAGLRCTLANSAYTSKELKFQYQDSGAKLVFVAEDLIPVVFEMFKLLGVSELEAQRRIVVLENGLEWAGGPPVSRSDAVRGFMTLVDLFNAGGKLDHEERFEGEQANETAYLCYSSGTTGSPKGVETTHLNINSAQECLRPAFPKLYSGKDLMLAMLPFYHIYGMVELLHFPILCGIPVVIMLRFDPVNFCAYTERYRITTVLLVPPVLVVLSRHTVIDNYDMSSLKTLVSGAAPLGADLVNQVIQRLNSRRKEKNDFVIIQGVFSSIRTSISVAELGIIGYGLTETSPSTHFLPSPDGIRKVGSIGILLPNLEARLVVDGNGDVEAEEGEPGELWIRGPIVMKGYLNNAAATKGSITPNGWLKTGDIATRDPEGYYYIVDRRKELIKYKGFQVPPAELEALLLNHPDVADAAVIGVYSEGQATELPRAYVVHAHPEQLRTKTDSVAFQQDVRKWTQEHVARHKFLRGGVVVIDVIPKSASGKILRRELRERAKLELNGQDPGSEENKAKL
ncbi:hypothetical protein C0992_005638 [Termitomyces sp. T32_za158]|nr:hypothetical protein C0992_005638 [Termitomyces sp. T32_za158]